MAVISGSGAASALRRRGGTTMNRAAVPDILRAARRRIEDPSNWRPAGTLRVRRDGRLGYSGSSAIWEAADVDFNREEPDLAVAALEDAVDVENLGALIRWLRAADHAATLAAFDRAITVAEART